MNVGFFNLARFPVPIGPKVSKPEEVSFVLTPASIVSRGYVMSSHVPRVPISGIPLEIILKILEVAHLNDNHEPDSQLMSACSLVCRSWSFHAQRLLFRHVRICSQAAYDSFAYAVDSSTTHGRALGGSVVQMHVVLDENQPDPLNHMSFARAVKLCPNLKGVSLRLYGCSQPTRAIVRSSAGGRVQGCVSSFGRDVLDILRTGPTISSLHFSNWSDNDDLIVQLLDVWPSLKALSLTGKTPHLSPALKRRPYYPAALEKLTMNCQVEPSLDFLGWLLHTSAEAKSLLGLELNREPSFHLLDFLVQYHGEQLHMLALPSCTTHKHAHAVIRCRALREFRTERSWVLPTIFRHLPEGIRHLAFGMDPTTSLQHAVELVKTRDELEAVTVNVWRGDCERQLAVLKMAYWCGYFRQLEIPKLTGGLADIFTLEFFWSCVIRERKEQNQKNSEQLSPVKTKCTKLHKKKAPEAGPSSLQCQDEEDVEMREVTPADEKTAEKKRKDTA
ncbi:hypothetical protein ID866_8856 [Astraeus odoratus]|nr:hypothetical protein ID866_8856 [Astraeus odoratus]